MSMRSFLFAADALRIEEGYDFNVQTDVGGRGRSRVAVGEQNAQSMAMLQGMMAGVKGAPRVGVKR